MRKFLALLLVVLFVVPAVSQANISNPIGEASYWQVRGCTHGHRSQVAKKRITKLLHHHNAVRDGGPKAVRHYVACTTTVKKHKYLKKHAKSQWAWRVSNVCTSNKGNRELGRCMAARDYGWAGVQFSCLDTLWGGRESGWSVYAHNPTSGAHGIPQALPGSKMGPGWWDNAIVQIRWGLGYIFGRYVTPCGALEHHNVYNWY